VRVGGSMGGGGELVRVERRKKWGEGDWKTFSYAHWIGGGYSGGKGYAWSEVRYVRVWV